MSKVVYFVNEETGREFRMISWDRTTNKMVLKGKHKPFEEEYSKEHFQASGYKMVVREEELQPEEDAA